MKVRDTACIIGAPLVILSRVAHLTKMMQLAMEMVAVKLKLGAAALQRKSQVILSRVAHLTKMMQLVVEMVAVKLKLGAEALQRKSLAPQH